MSGEGVGERATVGDLRVGVWQSKICRRIVKCNRFLHDSGVDRVRSSCVISAFRSRRKAAGSENNSEEKG